MIVENEYRIKLSDINRENKATNKAILSYLEDVGGKHSDIAGYGILDMNEGAEKAILLCDSYYGDGSSVGNACREKGIPVKMQNVELLLEEDFLLQR